MKFRVFVIVFLMICARHIQVKAFEVEKETIKLDLLDSTDISYIRYLIEQKKMDSAIMLIHKNEELQQDEKQTNILRVLLAEAFEAANLYCEAAKIYHEIYMDQDVKTDSLAWHTLLNTIINNSKSNNCNDKDNLLVEARTILNKRYSAKRAVSILNVEAIIFRKAGFFEQAHNSIDTAISINIEHDKEIDLSINYTTKANIFYYDNDFANALKYFQLAYQTGLNKKTPERRIKHKINLASAMHMNGLVQEAHAAYQEILSDKDIQLISLKSKASIFLNLAIMKIRTMEGEEIVQNLDSAILIGEQIRDYQILKTAYKEKARYHSFHKEYREAYKYSFITNMYMDSLKQDLVTSELMKVELIKMHENNKRDQAKVEIQQYHAKKQRKRFVYIVCVLCTITLVIIYVIKLKNKRLIELLNENKIRIEQKDLEYINSLKELERVRNFNVSLKRDNGRAKFMLQESIDFYAKLSKHLKKTLDVNKNINDLCTSLDDKLAQMKSSDFLNDNPENNLAEVRTRIKGVFPELTRNEVKLCVFMRMDMSTKEISGYTNTTVGSVEVAKYRMRKKMGFKSMEELQKWLNEV